jgi:hypothetical protein
LSPSQQNILSTNANGELQTHAQRLGLTYKI